LFFILVTFSTFLILFIQHFTLTESPDEDGRPVETSCGGQGRTREQGLLVGAGRLKVETTILIRTTASDTLFSSHPTAIAFELGT